ncbi:hypothetical protein H4Q26_000813 [Puccinia striiformis f. sp. tritici PST-130]|nr:hypothetical protein H4Q26_000813 [Puccinia striiformis f. sp. tritici PST-130]
MPSSSPHQLSTVEGFVSGALGACVAVTFTNPMEVAKTRLQLDGELRTKGTPKAYTNTFDVLRKTARSEGLRACQKGLGAAYTYQFALNGSRLGFYEPLRQSICSLSGQEPTKVQLWSSVSAGALSGVIGAILGNPLFLVKARLQAYSSVRDGSPTISSTSNKPALSSPHPTRHAYKSAVDGLHQIFKAEGFKGLMPLSVDSVFWSYATSRYKGSTAHFFRIAPHTIITLVANEAISQWWCTKMSTR